MPIQKYRFQAAREEVPLRLDQFLARELPKATGQAMSKSAVRKLIVAGAVYLNGKRVRIASKTLLPGARVEAWIDWMRVGIQAEPFLFKEDLIIHEDGDLIIVNKPPRLPTQPTLDEARDNLFHSVKTFLAEREGVAVGARYLGMHHRLDRDTSGLVLFTLRREANAGVAALFQEGGIKKIYHALTVAPSRGVRMPEEWEVKNYLGKMKGEGKRARFLSVKSGGDPAQTQFKLLGSYKHGLWVEASPRTGRTHQIRVHLSETGLPILGDDLYSETRGEQRGNVVAIRSVNRVAPRLMLHAIGLTFQHPTHKNLMSIHAPLPKDFLQCLETLKAEPATAG